MSTVDPNSPTFNTADGSVWRAHFRRLSELEEGDVPMLIKGILPGEGVSFLVSLAGVGKSLIALSMMKALRTGSPLFGHYLVPAIVPVAYLVPEMGSRAVRSRIEKMGIPDSEQFLLRTLKERIMYLDSPHLMAMVQELKPVLFLDTAIRFAKGAEENSAGANAVGLAEGIFALLRAGARAVVCLHHAPKNGAKMPEMTLENYVRGTGDFGAMAEVVWGIRRDRRKIGKKWDAAYEKESESLTRLYVEGLKGRDIPDVADPFVIQGRPYIDQQGDFALIRKGDFDMEAGGRSVADRLTVLFTKIQADSTISIRNLTKATGWNHAAVKKHALSQGWRQLKGQEWVKGEPGTLDEQVLTELETG